MFRVWGLVVSRYVRQWDVAIRVCDTDWVTVLTKRVDDGLVGWLVELCILPAGHCDPIAVLQDFVTPMANFFFSFLSTYILPYLAVVHDTKP